MLERSAFFLAILPSRQAQVRSLIKRCKCIADDFGHVGRQFNKAAHYVGRSQLQISKWSLILEESCMTLCTVCLTHYTCRFLWHPYALLGFHMFHPVHCDQSEYMAMAVTMWSDRAG